MRFDKIENDEEKEMRFDKTGKSSEKLTEDRDGQKMRSPEKTGKDSVEEIRLFTIKKFQEKLGDDTEDKKIVDTEKSPNSMIDNGEEQEKKLDRVFIIKKKQADDTNAHKKKLVKTKKKLEKLGEGKGKQKVFNRRQKICLQNGCSSSNFNWTFRRLSCCYRYFLHCSFCFLWSTCKTRSRVSPHHGYYLVSNDEFPVDNDYPLL